MLPFAAAARASIVCLALVAAVPGTSHAQALVDLRHSFPDIAPYTSPPSEPVSQGFSITGPGILRLRIVLSRWYRSSAPVRFRSRVLVDGRDEEAWTEHVPGVTTISSRSIPERWVDGAGLEQELEYRVPKARPQLEVALFPSTLRFGDGSVQQLGNSVSVVITFEPAGSAPSRSPGDATGASDTGNASGTITGSWADSDGPITLSVSGNRLTGSYRFRDGRMTGTVSGGNRVTGRWVQSSSGTRCATAYEGSYYWGRYDLMFTGDRFEGTLGWCDGPITAPWTGRRTGVLPGAAPSPPPVTTPPAAPSPITPSAGGAIAGRWADSDGPITLAVSGDRLTGTYRFRDGRMTGTVSGGNRATGYWMQSNSSTRCTTERDGTFFWGRFDLTFTGDRFEGTLGWCDGPITAPWTGRRTP